MHVIGLLGSVYSHKFRFDNIALLLTMNVRLENTECHASLSVT